MIPIHPRNYNFGWQITLRHDDPLTQHSWNSKIFQKSDLYMTVKIMSLYYRDTCHPLYFNEKFEFSNFGVNWINHSVFEYWLILVRISRSKNLTPKGVHHFYFSCQKWHIYLEQNSRIWNTGSYKECSKRKYLNVHKTLLKLFSIRIWRVPNNHIKLFSDRKRIRPRGLGFGDWTARSENLWVGIPGTLGAYIRSVMYKWINKNLNGLSELTLKLNLLILKSCSLSNKCFWARSEFFWASF